MDLSIVNNDFYLSGMATLIGDIDSKRSLLAGQKVLLICI